MMSLTIHVTDGETGWPLSERLDREVYPPEVMAGIVWKDVVWAHADWRIFARLDGEPVTHVGLYLRDAKDDGRSVRIGGIGGVLTLAEARGRGCAGAAMRKAAETMHAQACDFGLLFCEGGNVALYEHLGWRLFVGAVFCEQPQGRIKFDLLHTMILPVAGVPQGSTIDLCGLPW